MRMICFLEFLRHCGFYQIVSRSFVWVVRRACEDLLRLNVDSLQFKEIVSIVVCFFFKRKIPIHGNSLCVFVSNCHMSHHFRRPASHDITQESRYYRQVNNLLSNSSSSIYIANCFFFLLCIPGGWWNSREKMRSDVALSAINYPQNQKAFYC